MMKVWRAYNQSNFIITHEEYQLCWQLGPFRERRKKLIKVLVYNHINMLSRVIWLSSFMWAWNEYSSKKSCPKKLPPCIDKPPSPWKQSIVLIIHKKVSRHHDISYDMSLPVCFCSCWVNYQNTCTKMSGDVATVINVINFRLSC